MNPGTLSLRPELLATISVKGCVCVCVCVCVCAYVGNRN
jgi:hypothetical protein